MFKVSLFECVSGEVARKMEVVKLRSVAKSLREKAQQFRKDGVQPVRTLRELYTVESKLHAAQRAVQAA